MSDFASITDTLVAAVLQVIKQFAALFNLNWRGGELAVAC